MNRAQNQMIKAKYSFWEENLTVILEFFEHQLTDHNVNLSEFNKEDTQGRYVKPKVNNLCGSVACLGGWVAVLPHFKDIGIKRNKCDGSPSLSTKCLPEVIHYSYDLSDISYYLFGDDGMFAGRSRWHLVGDKSDRDVSVRRIKKQLKRVRKLEAKRERKQRRAQRVRSGHNTKQFYTIS